MHLIFGKEVMKYLVVVFTRGDQLEDDQTLDKHLEGAPPFLHDFLRKCNHRKVLFDNRTTNHVIQNSQRNNLVRVIDDMVRSNGGQPYTCEALKAAQDHALKMQQEKSKVKREKYEQEMLKKIEKINQANARKNQDAIKKQLEASAKSMAETNSKILQQNKEAYDREMNNLRLELHNSRAEVAHLRNRSIGGCPIS